MDGSFTCIIIVCRNGVYMLERDIIETDKGAALGIKVVLPNATLLLIIADKGYISCGYLNPDVIERTRALVAQIEHKLLMENNLRKVKEEDNTIL